MATEKVQYEKMTYRCRPHGMELLPLLCRDCDSPVCVDCVTASHAGHKLCKLSECIEGTINQLNGVIENKDSARFDLNKIEENLHNNQDRFKIQVEEMIQRVTEREGEIMREVTHVCKQTIENIKHLATENENQMRNDEEILNSFKACGKFQTENDKELIKSIYFYNELQLLQEKYVARDKNCVSFSFESCDLTLLVEKIVELVGSILTDEHSSSDEDFENIEIFPILHETNINDESLPHQYKQKFAKSSFNDIVLMSPEKKFIVCEDHLYHLSKKNVNKLGICTKHFTYVAETDEILYTADGIDNQDLKIYRQSVFIDGPRTLLFSCGNEKPLCIGHDAANYLTIITEAIKTQSSDFKKMFLIRFIDEMGCLSKPTCSKTSFEGFGRLKICLSSFVKIYYTSISVYKGFTFECLFSYSGRKGDNPSSTFSPADVCTGPDSNFLVIDSGDNTVHLLDPKGEFLRIIMSDEDGLRGITKIAMDSFGWLWMGCEDGSIHFANYEYFKTTSRRDRYLEKRKIKENV